MNLEETHIKKKKHTDTNYKNKKSKKRPIILSAFLLHLYRFDFFL